MKSQTKSYQSHSGNVTAQGIHYQQNYVTTKLVTDLVVTHALNIPDTRPFPRMKLMNYAKEEFTSMSLTVASFARIDASS